MNGASSIFIVIALIVLVLLGVVKCDIEQAGLFKARDTAPVGHSGGEP